MSDDEKPVVEKETAPLKPPDVPPVKTTDTVPLKENKKRGKSPVPGTSSVRKPETPQLETMVSSNIECKVLTQYQRVVSLAELREEVDRPSSNQWSMEEIDFRLEFLETSWEKFTSVHEALEETCTAAFLTHDYVRCGTYSKAYRPYQEARIALNKLKERLKVRSTREETSESESTSSGTTRQRLPEITLPKFSGEYSQWIPFRDLFLAMVCNNESISNVEKMHYLRTSLSGTAGQLIANLPVSGDSFSAAWSQLKARYENKRLLITAQLDKLFGDNSPSPKTAEGLNALINSTTESLNALTALGAPVSHWDHVLVHHITRRLDSTTRESWEVKQGSSMEPPTYEELKNYITGRARAMESIELGKAAPTQPSKPVAPSTSRQHLRTQPSRSYSLATENPGFPCSMCQSSHFVVMCPRFRALTSQARRDLVVQKRLCFNCLGPHNASSCQSTKRCRECNGKHHTMIHVGATGQPQTPSAGRDTSASSSSSKK